MTHETLNRYLAATLETLAEVESAPESILAIGLDGGWQMTRTMLLHGQLVTIAGFTVTITAKGREVVQKIKAFKRAA